MKPLMSMERTERIEQAASEWLARRYSGSWTGTDQCGFDRWLESSVRHRVAYLRLELIWQQTDRLRALGAGIDSDTPPPVGRWTLTPFFDGAQRLTPVHERATTIRRYALAATVLLSALLGTTAYYFWPAGRAYQTDVGAVASVPLADGSKVTLNTDSSLRISLGEKERHVDLRRGEAYFVVTHDRSRPFVVEAGKKRVIAVGTQFSVRRKGDDLEVVVTEGKVRVEDETAVDSGRVQDASPAARAPLRGIAMTHQPLYLIAGEIARVTEGGVLVQAKAPSQLEEQLSWRAGVLIFRDRSLGDAVAEFNRYNDRKIVIEDPAVAALRIEGTFRATNVDSFARLLEEGYSLNVDEVNGRIVLSQ